MVKIEKIKLKTLYMVLATIFIFFTVFIFINEYTLTFGEKVYLKTMPVDPRDLLRGDYLTLDYEICHDNLINQFIKNNKINNGETIYLILNISKNNYTNLKAISKIKPENGLFIKSQIIKNKNSNYNVKLGINKYFIPENINWNININEDLDVLVSIDNFGSAKIVDLYYNGTKISFEKK